MDAFTFDEQFTLMFFVIDKELCLPLCEYLRMDWDAVQAEHLNVKHGTMMSVAGFILRVLIGTHGRERTLAKLTGLGGEDPLAWAAASCASALSSADFACS